MTTPDLSLALFIAFVVSTSFNTGIQWYTHMETYPLASYVGAKEFPQYFHEYEKRLVFALYIPYSILMISNGLLFFLRPAFVEIAPIAVAFIANLAIMIISITLAVPLHKKHEKAGSVDREGVNSLLRVNLLRLGASLTSTIIAFYLLAGLIVS